MIENKNNRASVLIVEDDDINLFILEKMLYKHFELRSVTNGIGALELIANIHFDVILMDINLGDGEMDGVEVMLEVRSRPEKKATKIFAVTSYAMPEDEKRFLAKGFDRYFSKPIDKIALIEAIQSEVNKA